MTYNPFDIVDMTLGLLILIGLVKSLILVAIAMFFLSILYSVNPKIIETA